MNSGLTENHSVAGAAWAARAAGIFTWEIDSNTVYGDAVIAGLFNLEAELTIEGLPLQNYLTAMHEDDRPRVARAIHEAIVSGEPYQEEYRLRRGDGDYLWVLAIGHCFRNRDGNPSLYAGVIYDINEQKNSRTDGLSDHCQAALDVARRLENPRLIALLQQVIAEADSEDRRTYLQRSLRH